ncbi:hypothetical protein NECAME_03034 [Necator americanus]|uniref:Uncharacterized protein n=1 Tax=Necator americanus TaxID=51031 RepID=W2TA43_NECAM|nr:hypothetical protein NECAME_03034 [Necator americanus]ETN77862.1 hypothetical protein NECAME_03034 [Necator americanus]
MILCSRLGLIRRVEQREIKEVNGDGVVPPTCQGSSCQLHWARAKLVSKRIVPTDMGSAFSTWASNRCFVSISWSERREEEANDDDINAKH